MESTFNHKKDRWSITDITQEQYEMLYRCFDLVANHITWDDDMQSYIVDAESVCASFDDEEFSTIQSITF